MGRAGREFWGDLDAWLGLLLALRAHAFLSPFLSPPTRRPRNPGNGGLELAAWPDDPSEPRTIVETGGPTCPAASLLAPPGTGDTYPESGRRSPAPVGPPQPLTDDPSEPRAILETGGPSAAAALDLCPSLSPLSKYSLLFLNPSSSCMLLLGRSIGLPLALGAAAARTAGRAGRG